MNILNFLVYSSYFVTHHHFQLVEFEITVYQKYGTDSQRNHNLQEQIKELNKVVCNSHYVGRTVKTESTRAYDREPSLILNVNMKNAKDSLKDKFVHLVLQMHVCWAYES